MAGRHTASEWLAVTLVALQINRFHQANGLIIGRVFTKSCGLLVVLWLLLMGAYGYLALGKVGQFGPAVVVAILGGTFSTLFISAFIGLFTSGMLCLACASSRRGDAEPRVSGAERRPATATAREENPMSRRKITACPS